MTRIARRVRTQRGMLGIATAALLAAAATVPADAHPHVWIGVEAKLLLDGDAVTGIQQTWTFDQFYSNQASEGLDKNGDGKLDRSELAELAQVNMEGLKEFDYFTEGRTGPKPLDFGDPKDIVLEQVTVAEAPGPGASDGKAGTSGGAGSKVLALTFTLPLKAPARPDQDLFQFTVDDPTYFIWLELAKKDPVTLSGPSKCKVVIGSGEQSADQKKLADAFGGAGIAAPQDSEKTIKLECPKG